MATKLIIEIHITYSRLLPVDSKIYVREMIECTYIMAYGSTPYVGMAPKKNGGHIESAQMTRSKCLR